MQVYRGLPILLNQGDGARLVGIWPLDRQGTVGEYQQLAHAAIDEIAASGEDAGRCRWLRALVSGRAHRRPAAARRAAGSPAAVGEALRPSRACDRARGAPAPRPTCGGARPPERPQAGGPGARALGGGRHARARAAAAVDGPVAAPTLVVGLETARETLAARIRARTQLMFEQGVEKEVRAAGEVVPQVLGLDAVRSLPREEAIAELERATLRFAAYQRKWMRRIRAS